MQSDKESVKAGPSNQPDEEQSAGSSKSTENTKSVKDAKNSGLKKCFSALVDRKQVNLELEVLSLMLRKELNINLNSLDPDLEKILPYALVHYIKTWPGWSRSCEYYSGKITFKSWFEKFYDFIALKLNETINIHYKDVVADMAKVDRYDVRRKYMLEQLKDQNIQTDSLGPKVTAPFAIHINANAAVLNTLVFTHNGQGDIILKQHAVLEWDKKILDAITLKHLISWPHVGVHVTCPIFSFTRKNLHEFHRHISLVGTPLPSVKPTQELKIIDPKISRRAYTLEYLKEMTTDYIATLKYVYSSPDIVEVFETVIGEFLADVEELNVTINGAPTIANNTSIFYNIGKCSYFRNKKLARNVACKHDIAYSEVIIPKIELAIRHLADDDEIQEHLVRLRNFKPNPPKITGARALPQITFSCSYCEKLFVNGPEIISHLKDIHKMEQHMLCVQCKRQLTAFELSNTRWHHTCKPTAK